MDDLHALRRMMLIRQFEKRLLAFEKPGFQLLSSGEEAVAVGVCEQLRAGDQLLSSGRAIGPALARGVDPGRVMAELLGKRDGSCKGQGGRGHLSDPSAGFFGAHAVVAGNLTIAAGVALALQVQQRGALAVCMFGDGACGAGALHETLNIAALWKLPLLFVCNNNQYSVSTSVRDALAPRELSQLARPFGIEAVTVDGMDVRVVAQATARLVARVRDGAGPAFIECISYGFHGHSTSSKESRPRAEIEAWMARCPIRKLSADLANEGAITPARIAQLEEEAVVLVEAAAQFAIESPYPDPVESLRDVG